jgi:hypothetical protein
MPLRRPPHAPRPPPQTSPACLLVAQQIPLVDAPFNSAHVLAIAAQAVSPLPPATPDQRLIGTVYAGTASTLSLSPPTSVAVEAEAAVPPRPI